MLDQIVVVVVVVVASNAVVVSIDWNRLLEATLIAELTGLDAQQVGCYRRRQRLQYQVD